MGERCIYPSQIGRRLPRGDSQAKVTGAAKYAADVDMPAGLHARIVPSLYAHARIVSIDGSDAIQIPGVVAVLTAAHLTNVGHGAMRMYEPLAVEEVVFVGQPVALVIAESPEAAADAVQLVSIEYEPLDVVLDVKTAGDDTSSPMRLRVTGAMSGGASPAAAHADVGADAAVAATSGNVAARVIFEQGDPDAAIEGSDVVVTDTFRTDWVYQGYLETHAASAWLDADGTLVVAAGTQGSFYTQQQIADIYGLRHHEVRVIATPLGGSFGSKVVVIEPLVAGAALYLRQPVTLELTRREDLLTTNPAPSSFITATVGATRLGRLTGLRAELTFDCGAYEDNSIERIGSVMLAGPYRWPAFRIDGRTVRTNRFPAGMYRAPGGPQANFVIETLIDRVSRALSLDPVEFRRINLVRSGDPMVDGRTWPPIGAREVLDAVDIAARGTVGSGLSDGEGLGLALAVWPGGREPASALCRFDGDGTVTVTTGHADMTGASMALAAIAAEAIGVDTADVRVVAQDTSAAPRTPLTSGSVSTYGIGRVVREAAVEMRRQLLEYAAHVLEISTDDLRIENGVVVPAGAPDRALPLKDLAARLYDFGSRFPPVEGHAGSVHESLAPSACAQLVRASVDRDTGVTTLREIIIAQDAGRAVNPALVEAQMHGGVAQGVGWALFERLVHDETGQLVTGSLLDYTLPRSTHVPPIATIIVEVPSPDGPYGARGVGEASVVPTAAAIANAITAATGFMPTSLPMTAQSIWRGVQERRS